MKQLTLEEVLAAKEARQERQQALRSRTGLPLVSITLNIPGPVKDGEVLRQLCRAAADALTLLFRVAAEERTYAATGPEILLAVDAAAAEIKAAAVELEESRSYGRLWDIDVFAADGQLLSRQQQGRRRSCLLCADDARLCMRERRHSPEELARAVQQKLLSFQAEQTRRVRPAAEKLAALAVEAMLYEVAATPAPGLVDRANSGAHKDMDIFTFLSSSAALSHTLGRCAEAAFRHKGTLEELLPLLRLLGLEGERRMLTATQGVNTQKGLLFSLGLAVAAAAWVLHAGKPLQTEAVLAAAAEMVQGIVEAELKSLARKNPEELTAGERLYLEYGVQGIRGEVAAALPAVRLCGLPKLREALAAGLNTNDALVQTLLELFMKVDDTTVMNRHDVETMRGWVRQQTAEVLASGGMLAAGGAKRLSEMDTLFIARNISPGGAADMLAVTWFLHRLEGWQGEQE